MHRAPFYLDSFPDTIVLLFCCPMSCRVAELVPHFTLHALRGGVHCTCYSLVHSLATQFHCLGLASVSLSSTTAAVQMSGFLLLFWAPRNALVITYSYDIR